MLNKAKKKFWGLPAFFLALIAVVCAVVLQSQTRSPAGSQLRALAVIANSTAGTALGKFAKLTGTGCASTTVVCLTTAATGDTQGDVGVVVGGAGTTGSATLAQGGIANCVFDTGGATAGHYIIISAASAGECKDGGTAVSTTQENLGFALSNVATTGGVTGNILVQLAQH
jgi:hypothetical protein